MSELPLTFSTHAEFIEFLQNFTALQAGESSAELIGIEEEGEGLKFHFRAGDKRLIGHFRRAHQ
jgi:hypothetical protein